MAKMKHQELLKGLIRLHILHHAAVEEFYGQWMIHELASHGYTLSPGTLYPMLHQLERSGYLRSREERLGRTYRRIYRATALGKEANRVARSKSASLPAEVARRGRNAGPSTNRRCDRSIQANGGINAPLVALAPSKSCPE